MIKIKKNQKENQWEYTPKRNDSYINCYDRQCLEIWRENMDIQIISSAKAVIHYISIYTTKSEVKRNAFSNYLKIL